MKTQTLPLLLSFIAAISGAAANLLFKKGSSQVLEIPIYQNISLLFGLGLFTLVLILFMTAFRLGGETITVYPAYATTYIWIALLSWKFEGTSVTKMQILGMLFVILGVSLIGMGFKNN